MDKYVVRLSPKAYRDIESIYEYISKEKLSPQNAKGQVDRIKDAILSLETFPDSHQERHVGRYANQGYRHLLIDNYMAIFRIDKRRKAVIVITVQYQGRNI